MPYRVIFIGAGGRGRHWMRQVGSHPAFQPVAIVDPASGSRRRVAEEFGDLHLAAYTRLKDAARDVHADVAIVAAVSRHRRENCLIALSAGWHLLVEKPFALSLDDARAIVRAGEQAGRVVSVGQNYRFGAAVGAMRRLIAGGELGELGHGVFVRHRRRYGAGTYQQAMRHNYLWEMGVHDLDTIRFTLGLRPLRATGVSFQPPWGDFEGETTVGALFEFEQGVRVNYFGAWASHVSEMHWRVDGSRGALRLTDGLQQARPQEGEWQPVEDLGSAGGEAALLHELAQAIRTGDETSTSGRDNLWTVAMMEAVVRSTETGGEPVALGDLFRE